MNDRYFVDERIACIAVRDRNFTDPDDQGLDWEKPGVVYFRMISSRDAHPRTRDVAGCRAMAERLNRAWDETYDEHCFEIVSLRSQRDNLLKQCEIILAMLQGLRGHGTIHEDDLLLDDHIDRICDAIISVKGGNS